MAIARRNRMMLRLNSALTLYARALMLRRDRKAALQVANKSLAMAKGNQFGLEEAKAVKLIIRLQSGLDTGAVLASRLPI